MKSAEAAAEKSYNAAKIARLEKEGQVSLSRGKINESGLSEYFSLLCWQTVESAME